MWSLKRVNCVWSAQPPPLPRCHPQKEDLPILCERHTTSKLRSFEDLSSISTLGFRGEALASISYVAHVTVTTLPAADAAAHGWRATYRDGAMDSGGPRPAAATRGTVILAEDLFYNAPLRRRALRPASEEYAAILDVAGRYAVYRAGAAVAVRKAGEAKADLATAAGGTRVAAIRAVYGAAVARHCLPLALRCGGGYGDDAAGGNEGEEGEGPKKNEAAAAKTVSDSLRCSVDGYVTGADYVGRKTQLVLFINGRSVEFPPLKRCLEATYGAVLPKGAAKPFAFLDVRMPPGDVDVNVHPTKKEVAFLHQEELVAAVAAAVEAALLDSNAQRTYKQALLPGAGAPLGGEGSVPHPAGTYRPEKLVRTDARTQTLDAFVGTQQAGGEGATQAAMEGEGREGGAAAELAAVPRRRRGGGASAPGDAAFLPTAMEIAGAAGTGAEAPPPAAPPGFQPPPRHRLNPAQTAGLASVERLLAAQDAGAHAGIAEILRGATFVGLADSRRALVQAGTRLYLVDLAALSRDMFYQQALRRFGQAAAVALRPPAPVAALAEAALAAEEAAGRWTDTEEGGTKDQVAALLAALLAKKAGLLADCFGVRVTGDGDAPALAALPQLIEQYHPPAAALPRFVLALGRDVDWAAEEACFAGVAAALADLYAWRPYPALDEAWAGRNAEQEGAQDGEAAAAAGDAREREWRRREWEAAHVLLPALRLFLAPPAGRAGDGSVVELTRLEHLYRVFERC